MAQFIEVPSQRLETATLRALLEEFASRDGTDYGQREFSLEEKIDQLQRQLDDGQIRIIYNAESEQWDLLDSDQARDLYTE